MARGRNIGNVYAELSVKDKMTVGIKRAESALTKFGKSMARIGTGLALAAPAAALAGLTASMKSAIDAGGKLSDMMARTGANGEGLFLMQRAFENAGIAGDKVPGVLNKMQKALAGVNEEGKQVMSRVFDDLGLSLNELRGMDATGAFRRISESIAAIPDPAKRAALAMEIFGRSGGELLVMMTDGKAFEVAAQQVGGLGKTLADNANQLDKVSDSLSLMKIKAQQVGAEVAVAILPALEEMAEALNSLDLGQTTRDMIDFAKSIGWAADKMAELVKQSAVGKTMGFFGKGAEMGISALASLNPETGTALDPVYLGGGGFAAAPSTALDAMPTTDNTREWWQSLERIINRIPPGKWNNTGIAGMNDMVDAISRAQSMQYDDAIEEERRIGDFQAQAYDVNEMQRRGLGMGGEGIAKQANKEVELLQQIRDLIRNAPDRDMVWN